MAKTTVLSPDLDRDLDDASVDLILKIQMEDLAAIQAQMSGKQREGTRSDLDFALLLTSQNLGELRTCFSDYRMARSIASAVQRDGHMVATARQEEEVASSDHELARRLNGSAPTHLMVSPASEEPETIEDQLLAKLAGTYLSEDAGIEFLSPREEAESTGESSAHVPKRQNDVRNIHRECVACREIKKYFDVISGPCGHEYCRACLRELFEASMTDESLFPPRCCRQPITVERAGLFLTKEEKHRFEEKKVEFSTPNRTYCSNASCSAFIPADDTEGDDASCRRCGLVTCALCKEPEHVDDCPKDTDLHEFLNLASQEGWQRCNNCRSIVQLEVGCNHITCRCGAEFCYVCGVPWKTCSCPQWDEDNLLARANVIVNRQPQEQGGGDRNGRIQAAAQMLRAHHDCLHRNWRYISGSHQCEECHHTLPNYIFECRQCQIRACNRCRRNRLL